MKKQQGGLETALKRIEALEAAQEKALGYATRLLESFVEQHFPPNPDWKPQPDLIGVLMQLDNASTIARDYKARIEALKAALRMIADKSYPEPATTVAWTQAVAVTALAEERDNG